MDDEKIIELFFARAETAISALADKYGTLCLRLAGNILPDRRDAEECVSDTYWDVWNAIPPERPNPLVAFLCRLVRNRSLNRYKFNQRKKRNSTYTLCLEELTECLSAPDTVETAYDAAELSRYIDDYLDSLTKDNRLLFVRRYWFMDSCRELATKTGLTEGAVRTRLSRLRAELKAYLESRGVNV